MSERVPVQSAWRIFAVPLTIGVASLAGLILGLTGDGFRDALCWALLALPLIALLPRPRPKNSELSPPIPTKDYVHVL